MAPKKTEKISVMIDEDMKERLASIAFSGDITPSDLVRSCILVALPLFESTPSLIQIIPTLPTKNHRMIDG